MRVILPRTSLLPLLLLQLVCLFFDDSFPTVCEAGDVALRTRSVSEDDDDGCMTSVDCAMNGDCLRGEDEDGQAPGKCDCVQGWKGIHCEVLDLQPVTTQHISGLQLPNQTSTWGGSIVYRDGLYHMYASEMVLGCGLGDWTSNSQVIRAVSSNREGPYKKAEVILPTFAHEPNVVEAPTGELVMFITARPGVTPRDCRRPTTTSTRSSRKLKSKSSGETPPMDTYMIWASSPEGPWSDPVCVLNSTIWNTVYWEKYDQITHCDSNLNGIILPNNIRTNFVGIWRRCETADLKTIPHTLFASDWKDPQTYQPNIDPTFVLGGSGAEDPSNIWTTTTRDMDNTTTRLALHVLFHDEQSTRCMEGQCSANGRHAFSLDEGKSWRYASTDAYDRSILFDNNTVLQVDTRARPHVVVDSKTNNVVAISTGIQPDQDSGYVWTLVQSVVGGSGEERRGEVVDDARRKN